MQKEVVAVINGNATLIGRVQYPIIFCGLVNLVLINYNDFVYICEIFL